LNFFARHSRYSGDRDKEDHGLKIAQANCSEDPTSKKKKKNHKKSAGRVAQGIAPEFNPQYHTKKNH
jgi:hypothetical protein